MLHPLAPLTAAEFTAAAHTVQTSHPPTTTLFFRSIYLHEPPKADVVAFLIAEHAGEATEATPRPARLAVVEYDVVTADRHAYAAAVVDVAKREVVRTTAGEERQEPYYTGWGSLSASPVCPSWRYSHLAGPNMPSSRTSAWRRSSSKTPLQSLACPRGSRS
jgi:hypothetical protein